MLQYLPDSVTTLTLVSSVGVAFILAKQLVSFIGKTTYAFVIVLSTLCLVLYPIIRKIIVYIYNTVTGTTSSNVLPPVSLNPNITMYPTESNKISTSGNPVISSHGTTATPYFGMSTMLAINTSVANPAPDSPYQADYAPLVDILSVADKVPVMSVGYMPQGNLMQLLFYPPISTNPDIPGGSDNITRITLGTPPIKKKFSLFVRTNPVQDGKTAVEVYINGVLGKTATVDSAFFRHGGNVVAAVGYPAEPTTYPIVDAELQSLMVWANASTLSINDIQSLATQDMDTSHETKHQDTTKCK